MNNEERALLCLLSGGLAGKKRRLSELPEADMNRVFGLAAEQSILPLVFDASVQIRPAEDFAETWQEWKKRALGAATREIAKTNELLLLLEEADRRGLHPIVVKGLPVRNLYLVPCLRPSVDEDFLIEPGEAEAFHAFFEAERLREDDPGISRDEKFEISYHRPESPTYIELHKYLFDPGDAYFKRWNDLFAGAYRRTVTETIEGVPVRVLAPTDHLLYLILHAMKHFLYSGFGVRLAADIAVFAEAHAEEIDWSALVGKLKRVGAFDFTRALLKIGEVYLVPGAGFFGRIASWKIGEIDEEPLLADLLIGGVHGNVSLERLHSSSVTLTAAEGGKSSVWGRVFISRKSLVKQYPYLKRFPFLLPAAWGARFIGYVRETREGGTKLAEPMRIGSERVKLLKMYHIID